MTQEQDGARKRTGRPRSFDRAAALDQALQLFWAKGYEAVSIAELTAAMGIHSPSFYSAFGSKQALFAEAVRRYEEAHLAPMRAGLAQASTAADAVEGLLQWTVHASTGATRSAGCLLALGALNRDADNEAVVAHLDERRRVGDALLLDRLKRAEREEGLPVGYPAETLAAYVSTINLGLSLQARNGASGDMLNQVVDAALLVFRPGRPAGDSAHSE